MLHERINEAFIKRHIRDIAQRFYLCGPAPRVKELRETPEVRGARSVALPWEK